MSEIDFNSLKSKNIATICHLCLNDDSTGLTTMFDDPVKNEEIQCDSKTWIEDKLNVFNFFSTITNLKVPPLLFLMFFLIIFNRKISSGAL